MKAWILTAAFLLAASGARAETATANLSATVQGSPVSGVVRLEEKDGSLFVSAQFQGVPAGKHGFHIHENGACGDEGKAAGGHFNPEAAPHGLLHKDGFSGAHAGDFGNVEIGADGTGTLEATLPGLNLTEGPLNVRGKAVILHEKEDDFSQPTGNAGGRIGCGIIE